MLISAFVVCAFDVICKNIIAKMNVRELLSYVFFWEFYGIRSSV